MKDKVITIGGIIFVVLTLAVSAGLTYSFFTASVGGNEQARETVVDLAELRLKFTDTQNIQMLDALPGQAVTKTFSVENKGDVEIEYTIDIENLTNTFVNNELVYSLTSTNGGATATRKAIPTTERTLETATIAPGVTQTYTMTVLFKETGSNQNSNMGAIFGGVLQINSRGEYKYVWYNGCYDDNNNLNCKVIAANTAVSDANIDYGQTSEQDGTNGLYYTEENTEGNERVYFYRGIVENNYLVFGTHQTDYKEVRGYHSATNSDYIVYNSLAECNNASSYNYNCTELILASAESPMCWRIVRTNEDGSVRLRYGGAAIQNGETYTCPQTGTEVNIGSAVYNELDNDKNYANYKTCNIRTVVENWYRDNLGSNIALTSLIADAPYCIDMSERVSFIFTLFGAYDRLVDSGENAYNPQYKCPSSAYAYTVAKGDLTYPIGLLTADEVAYAGGVYFQSNSSYYLNTGESYWTMSPYRFFSSSAVVFYVSYTGLMNGYGVDSNRAAVPVVSLKAEASVDKGTGLYNDPFVINTD